MSLYQFLAVKERQYVERGVKHLPHFVVGQGPAREDLSESLPGIFHDDEEKLMISYLATTRIKEVNQVRMGERGCRPPAYQQSRLCGRICWNNLNRGSWKVSRQMFGQEYRTVV